MKIHSPFRKRSSLLENTIPNMKVALFVVRKQVKIHILQLRLTAGYYTG